MALEIINDTIMKAPSSPPHPLLNSKIPLTIFDLASLNTNISLLLAYEPPTPSNDSFIGIAPRILYLFPYVAGRLSTDEHGRPCYLLNNAGMRFIQTHIAAALADHLPLLQIPSERKKLHPPAEGDDEYLMQFQLSRFTCGGVIVGITCHHRLADGYSFGLLASSIPKLMRGLDVDPLPYPDRDRAIFVPRNPPVCEFNHQAIEFRDSSTAISATSSSLPSPIVNFTVYFSPEFISKLRAHVRGTAEGEGHRYTIFECLVTHLWKKITMARGLDGNKLTHVKVAVNGRERMEPAALLMRYFGNLVLWAYPTLKVEELLNQSYAFVTETIRDAVAKVDRAYFQSFIDFGEMVTREGRHEELVSSEPQIGTSLSPNIEVHSLLQVKFNELDFGNGGPCAFIHAGLPVDGMMFFIPSTKEKGGVEASMALQQQHVERFMEILHSLPSGAEPRQGPQNSHMSLL